LPFGGLLTVGLISAGVQLYGAHKASSAAKKASEQQVASANQAKSDLEPLYRESVNRMQPYADMGLSALGQTRSLMGYPAPPPQTGRDAQGKPLGPFTGEQGPMNMSDPRVQHLAAGGSLADLGSTGATPMGGGGSSSYGGMTPQQMPQVAAGMQQAMLKMRAPDGEVRDVPSHLAAQLEQAGAVRV
jgi:hypothetical protein